MYKISQLTELSNGNVADADYFEIIDDSDTGTTGSGKNKRVTVSSLSTKFSSNISAFTSNQSKAVSSGYQKLPGGVILQWGKATGVAEGGTVTFPLAFPTACTFVGINPIQVTAGEFAIAINLYASPLAGSFRIERSASSASCDFQWYAIGY